MNPNAYINAQHSTICSMEDFGIQLGFETGAKLYVYSLDYGVSNDDMKVGKMK